MLLLKLIALFSGGYSNHDRPTDNHVRRFLQRHEIPYHYLPTTSGNKREQEILELIEGTDFAVLARYMQVSVLFSLRKIITLETILLLVISMGGYE
jgi:formyltetrahydrofolate hydrolase